jgi:hypothetical protein
MAIEFNAMNNTIPLAYHFVLISSPSIYVVGNFLQYLSIQRGQVAVDIFIKEKKKKVLMSLVFPFHLWTTRKLKRNAFIILHFSTYIISFFFLFC